MGVLRDPLLPKATPKQKGRTQSRRIGVQNEAGTAREVSRYDDAEWPVGTREQRIALLDQITADLKARRIDRFDAYHERLRWAFRCLEEDS